MNYGEKVFLYILFLPLSISLTWYYLLIMWVFNNKSFLETSKELYKQL